MSYSGGSIVSPYRVITAVKIALSNVPRPACVALDSRIQAQGQIPQEPLQCPLVKAETRARSRHRDGNRTRVASEECWLKKHQQAQNHPPTTAECLQRAASRSVCCGLALEGTGGPRNSIILTISVQAAAQNETYGPEHSECRFLHGEASSYPCWEPSAKGAQQSGFPTKSNARYTYIFSVFRNRKECVVQQSRRTSLLMSPPIGANVHMTAIMPLKRLLNERPSRSRQGR